MDQKVTKGCILLICGLPLSGKTLLTQNFINYSKLNPIKNFGSNVDLFKISIDDLMPISEQSLKIQINGFWKQFRHNVLLSTKVFINQLIDNQMVCCFGPNISSIVDSIKEQNNLSDNESMSESKNESMNKCNHFVVIIDDNFYYKSMRYEWFKTSKEFGLGFGVIMINCSLDLALNRNQLRTEDKCLPEDVIIKMYERFESPERHGFEMRTHFVFADAFDYKISDALIEFTIDAINNPIIDSSLHSNDDYLKQRLNMDSKTNIIHKMDCILRIIINEIIINSEDKRTVAKSLNESKKCLLNGFKQSMDCLPQNILNQIIKSQPIVSIDNEIKLYFKQLLNS